MGNKSGDAADGKTLDAGGGKAGIVAAEARERFSQVFSQFEPSKGKSGGEKVAAADGKPEGANAGKDKDEHARQEAVAQSLVRLAMPGKSDHALADLGKKNPELAGALEKKAAEIAKMTPEEQKNELARIGTKFHKAEQELTKIAAKDPNMTDSERKSPDVRANVRSLALGLALDKAGLDEGLAKVQTQINQYGEVDNPPPAHKRK